MFEGDCLLRMLRTRLQDNESMDEYQHRKFARCREAFQDKGHQSLVQRFLYKTWLLGMDVSRFASFLPHFMPCADRAWRDSRLCMLSFGARWDDVRTRAGDWMHQSQSQRQRLTTTSLKRRRLGRESIGARTWHYPFECFFGKTWWSDFDPSAWWKFSEAIAGDNMFKYFRTQMKKEKRADTMSAYIGLFNDDEEEGGDQKRRKKNEEEITERLSRRIALHAMRSTCWDFEGFGFPVEISGDSLLIINWLCGVWQVGDHTYQKRVNKVINTMDGMSSMYNVRAACQGRDVFKHEFREFNERADRLTHMAREGRSYTLENYEVQSFSSNGRIPIAVRGSFDGGVSEAGVGCGAWMEVAFASHNSRICWETVFERAWLIDPSCTVTESELSAAECMVHALCNVLVPIAHVLSSHA